MSSQLSAQAITAQTAITRISIRRCSILPGQRGSPTALRCRTRLSIDMILSRANERARHHSSGSGFIRLGPATKFHALALGNRMRVLVTGSAGFIGYHLGRRLLAEGHAVTGLDGFSD